MASSAGGGSGRGDDFQDDRTGQDRNKDLKHYLSPDQVPPSMLEKSSSLQVNTLFYSLTLLKNWLQTTFFNTCCFNTFMLETISNFMQNKSLFVLIHI